MTLSLVISLIYYRTWNIDFTIPILLILLMISSGLLSIILIKFPIIRSTEIFFFKNFTKEIEKVVSKNAMIFILPVNYFPEGQGDYYRELSPYLNSSQLRFTYPINKGSKALEWQENIQKGIKIISINQLN